MSDLQKLADSPFVIECRRLHAIHLEARKSGDVWRIETAIDAFTEFLRMHRMGRLDEYLASRQEHNS